MTQHSDDNDVDTDPVVRAADERIRREALRQLNSVDIEDDHARMERLTTVDATHVHRDGSDEDAVTVGDGGSGGHATGGGSTEP